MGEWRYNARCHGKRRRAFRHRSGRCGSKIFLFRRRTCKRPSTSDRTCKVSYLSGSYPDFIHDYRTISIAALASRPTSFIGDSDRKGRYHLDRRSSLVDGTMACASAIPDFIATFCLETFLPTAEKKQSTRRMMGVFIHHLEKFVPFSSRSSISSSPYPK